MELEAAFERGIIQPKGFIPLKYRRASKVIADCVGKSRFKTNPVDLVMKIIDAHHESLAKFSHVACILIRGIKPEETWEN